MRGLAQNVSAVVLEELVFSKPYFVRDGFIVATENDRPVGFVHAAFGPNRDFSSISHESGVICMVMVEQRDDQQEIRRQLLGAAEDYLVENKAKRIHAMGHYPIAPFYLGLYGGSRMPGILREDVRTIELFSDSGYETVSGQLIMQCRLAEFRPRVDRQTMMVRRQYQIQATFDPSPRSWWEACTIGCKDRTRFEIFERSSSQCCGQVTLWDINPISRSWGVNAMGLLDLNINEPQRRQGLASFLIAEAIRQMQEHSVSLAEIQTASNNQATIALFEKLGFSEVDEGIVLVKNLSS